MIVSAHQPAYLPWLGYFHKMALSDVFVVLDDVQFEKNSFINRNRVKTHNGPIYLTVPVLLKGHTDCTIRDIEINRNEDWRSKHWKTIYFNYKKAPFFSKYSEYFEDLYKNDWVKLNDLLNHTLSFFITELKINSVLHKQSDLGINSKKQQLILDLCKRLNAEMFVFGVLGKDYADAGLFAQEGVKILFQDYQHPVYSQMGGEFVSSLSAIDLLFNVGPERSFDIIMSGNINKKNLGGGGK